MLVLQRGFRRESEMRKHSNVTKVITVMLALCVMMTVFGAQAFAMQGDEYLQTRARAIASKAGTEEVKTIHWVAKLTKKAKVTITGTGEMVPLKKGAKVTIVQRDYHAKAGISECELADGRRCYIPNRFLNVKKPLGTGALGDYDRKTKEAFVNGEGGIAGLVGDKLIWISLDKQRVNVFQGSRGNWTLIQEFPCSTGKADAPTFDQSFKKVYKVQKKEPKVSYGKTKGLQWYTFIYGYGMHQWKGGGKANIGLVPLSHSCVRLRRDDAKWIYDDANIPVGTRIYVW